MNCPECNIEMAFDEPVHSNFTSSRAEKGEHTGDIYVCHTCQVSYLDNFLSKELHICHYE